jgi:hypothetical protein
MTKPGATLILAVLTAIRGVGSGERARFIINDRQSRPLRSFAVLTPHSIVAISTLQCSSLILKFNGLNLAHSREEAHITANKAQKNTLPNHGPVQPR